MTAVELRGVGKVYPDGHRAVRGVDLSIGDGELFVLVGPSGCGKTSVLRMVAGLEDITEGDIVVDGVSVGEQATNRRNLAMLFQTSALYPHMTVRQNIGFPLKMARVRHREVVRRAERVAATLGLSDVLDERPARLSGGQRQRVAMGRAIIRDPALLLMDEPMSNLDAKLRTELRGEIAAMQRRLGITTLYVTHDQVEAMSLGHRAAVMRDGLVVQCDTPSALYLHPIDIFVARFVGSPPMNVLAAELVDEPAGPVLAIGSARIELGAAAARWPDFDDLVGRPFAVGIRPDCFTDDPEGSFDVEITHVEHLGAEKLVHATFAGTAVGQPDRQVVVDDAPVTTLVASLTSDVEVNIWRPIRLRVDPAEIHLFELDGGAAVPTTDVLV